MDRTPGDEKRDCVRAGLCADVEFSVLEGSEYDALREKGEFRPGRFATPVAGSGALTEEDVPAGRGVDPNLIHFLIQIEDKLDRILGILAQNERGERKLFLGRGLDIGGGGMRMLCEKALRPGQVLDASFRIFRYPVVSLRVFARVVRVNPADTGGKGCQEVALEFLDLDEADKEWIISYVFQIQRESIRNKKR